MIIESGKAKIFDDIGEAVEQDFWLILPPCADRDDWVATIKPLAESAGFTVFSSAAEASKASPGKALILTRERQRTRQAGAASENLAVILSDAGPLLPEIDTATEPAPRHTAVRNASELTARLRCLSGARFHGGCLKAGSGGNLSRP
ncbi:hypothetical protein FQR65_LT20991 [Abscondita terminalis]|nr:hypothetical protein FQR65_LT20991 [Abscondita terminalis]